MSGLPYPGKKPWSKHLYFENIQRRQENFLKKVFRQPFKNFFSAASFGGGIIAYKNKSGPEGIRTPDLRRVKATS
jgi:hypothetical protein